MVVPTDGKVTVSKLRSDVVSERSFPAGSRAPRSLRDSPARSRVSLRDNGSRRSNRGSFSPIRKPGGSEDSYVQLLDQITPPPRSISGSISEPPRVQARPIGIPGQSNGKQKVEGKIDSDEEERLRNDSTIVPKSVD